MPRRPHLLTALLPLLLALAAPITTPASAQDGAEPAPTVAPADVDPEALRLQLLPLRGEAIAEEAENWMAALEASVAALAEGELAARTLEGEERSAQLTANAKLAETRSKLITRVKLVLDAWEAKGGDVAAAQKYVHAVSGTTVDVRDAMAVTTMAREWLKSEEGGVRLGKSLALFFVILIGAWIVAGLAAGVVGRAIGRFGTGSALLRKFLVGMTRRTIILIGLVAGVAALGVPMGPFVAAIGAAGLVIGLALQGTLSNFASGILILLYRPFDVDDVVTVGGVTGKVKAMTLMTTTLGTPDNQTIIVPNNTVWGSVITNVTGNPTRRVDMTFGIGYGDDIEKARGILHDVVTKHPLVHADPEPMIQVATLGDSSVNFVVRPWTNTADYWTVLFDVTTEVKKRFDAEDVSIPFPQRDVHVYQHAT